MPVDPAKIYQAFDPAPLQGNQQSELYVDLGAVRGETQGSAVARVLAQRIRLSKDATCQLLSGHRGSGKSTELLRLQRELREGESNVYTVYCDVNQTLNRSDLEFPDLLLAIVRQLATQLKKDLKISLKPGYFRQRFEELKDLLASSVKIDELELDTGLIQIVGSLRSSGTSRTIMRQIMEPKVDQLLYAANEVINEAKQKLKVQGFSDLAILVDNTDHLIRRTGDHAEEFPGENLFIRRSPEVAGFRCHVVYTIPLALAFSCHEAELTRIYGSRTPIVGIAKLRDRAGKAYEQGMVRFRDLIQKRVEFAGAKVSDLFVDDRVRDELIRLTGGQLLMLCTLIRDGLIAGLPLSAERVEELRRSEHRTYARWLEREHWKIIKSVRDGFQPIPDHDNRGSLRDLIEGRALLYHMNNEEWWAVSPSVGEPPSGV